MPTIFENDEGVQLDDPSVTDELFLPVGAHRPSQRVVEADEETRLTVLDGLAVSERKTMPPRVL